MRRRRFRGSRMGLGIALAGIAYVALLAAVTPDVPTLLRLVSAHLLVFSVALLTFLSLIAQFVLPVRSASERRAVIGRLLGYMLGDRGTVTFVDRGVTGARSGDGAGVIWTDHLSAAVLRTDSNLSRALGPGELAFTVPGERLAGALDLRRQRRSVSAVAPPTGEPARAEDIESLALTLDGIPVSADLSIVFALQRRLPISSRTVADPPPIAHSEPAVRGAVYGQIVGGDQALMWDQLPLKLVVELWRDFVKQRPLNDFLNDPVSTVAEIEESIRLALSSQGKTRAHRSQELRLLQERGILIHDVTVGGLRLPEEIQEERLQAWFDDWAGPVRRELIEAQEAVRQATRLAEAGAAEALLEKLSTKLGQQLRLETDIGRRDTAILVLEDALEICASDSRLSRLAPRLRTALDQARRLASDCTE